VWLTAEKRQRMRDVAQAADAAGHQTATTNSPTTTTTTTTAAAAAGDDDDDGGAGHVDDSLLIGSSPTPPVSTLVISYHIIPEIYSAPVTTRTQTIGCVTKVSQMLIPRTVVYTEPSVSLSLYNRSLLSHSQHSHDRPVT